MEYKILIADDQKEYIQSAMNFILQQDIPYALLGAPNGKRAVEIAQHEKPDIIIMDWEMPVMNGIDAIVELKKLESTKDIPIIMSTGIRISTADLKIAFEAGASDYIRKPLEKTEFIARINSHLKIAKYIKTIKYQAKLIESEQLKHMEDKVSCLLEIIEDNKSQTNHFVLLLDKIIARLKQVQCTSENQKSKIDSLSNEIELAINTHTHLFRQINTSNNSFIKTILHHHPSLSPQEVQLCSLLKHNLSTKDIAALTFREVTSVKVLRSRLRKKLQLGRNTNLCNYFITLEN